MRRKRVIVSSAGGGATEQTGRDSDGGSSDSDNSRTTLGDSGGPDADKRSSEQLLGYDQTQSILGSSSSQPLRLRRQNYVDRNKNHIFRFVGDQQASTDMGMANLFGAHPARIHRTMQPDPNDVLTQTLVDSESTQTHSYCEQADESIHLAGVDAERPSAELLECIKYIATDKILKQMAVKKNAKGIPETELHVDYSQLDNKFDESALVAVGILVEELVRDMMIDWYKTGNPLTLDPRALRTEALAQMNGSTAKDVPVSLLMNRLEVRIIFILLNIMQYYRVFFASDGHVVRNC